MTNNIPIGSPVRTQAIINRYFVKAKKNLGQNFLIDQNAILGIVEAADIHAGDQVIEIGPGIGSLTEQLLLAGAKVFAYEVDDSLPDILQNELPKKIGDAPLEDRFKLMLKDVLKADFKEDLAGFFDMNKPIKVVANLPYYITTPILMHLLDSGIEFETIVVMMQKEVAERLAANPGTKAYGSLSVAVQYEMDSEIAFIVPKTVFVPQPNVDSAIIVLNKKKVKPKEPQDEKHFKKLVKGSFMHRRKSLWNNLQSLYGKDPETKEKMLQALEAADVKQSIRAEKLTVADFINLSDALVKMEIN